MRRRANPEARVTVRSKVPRAPEIEKNCRKYRPLTAAATPLLRLRRALLLLKILLSYAACNDDGVRSAGAEGDTTNLSTHALWAGSTAAEAAAGAAELCAAALKRATWREARRAPAVKNGERTSEAAVLESTGGVGGREGNRGRLQKRAAHLLLQETETASPRNTLTQQGVFSKFLNNPKSTKKGRF